MLSLILLLKRLINPQRGRGHATAIVLCVPIQQIQWFVTNYSNSCCLNYTLTLCIENFYNYF